MSKINISRRDFLKGTAAGAAALAATGLTQGAAFADSNIEENASYVAMAGMNPQDYSFRDGQSDMSHIFSPWKFGGLTLSHRMVKSAGGSDTQRGSVEEATEYYGGFAKGGVEMVWVEDHLEFKTTFKNPRSADPATSHIKDVIAAVHEAGAYIGYQLSAMSVKFSGFDPATAKQFETANAENMTIEELKLLQQDFIQGAKIMQDLGFDAVEINAAGNNIGQAFFSRQRNHRDDEYGPQSFENRARFVGEIIAGIKELCGADFPVQVLINAIEENDIDMGQSDLTTTVEENCQICKVLEDYGADSIHARLGVFRMHVCQFASDLYFTGTGITGTAANGMRFDFSRHFEGKLVADHDAYGLMLDVAAEIKKHVSIPVGAVTCNTPHVAPKFFDDAIAEGKVDFFLMNRPLTVNPDYVNLLREGRLDEIAPCCRCMHCHFDYKDDGTYYEHCRVNAATQHARHAEMPEGAIPTPAEAAKKVMVIGAGPAGMEAARIAAQRGHDVTLYEKSGAMGGLLTYAEAIKGKHENLGDLRKYLIRQQELKGVKVVTGTEVTREMIDAEAPDAVILAVGGKRPELEFASTAGTLVIGMDDYAMNAGKIGQNVTIIGGNAQAVDMAQYLISQGKHITMVSPESKALLDKGQSSWVKQFTIPMLYANGMRLWPNASVKAVNDGEVVVAGETGCDMIVKCDTLIDARDMLPNTELIEGLDNAIAVGDCSSPYNIAEAIYSGNIAARNI